MQAMLAAWLTLILTFTSVFGLVGEKYDVYENIRYGEAERDLVTIYVPKNAYDRDYNGCILYIHGGSWQGGEKEDMAPHCKKLAMKGYITATMSYSLYSDEVFGEVTAFTMCDEIDACIDAIKQFGEEKELNITKLATSGYSAGGHISMLYSYSRPQDSSIELAFTANRVGPSDMNKEVWGSYGLASMLAGVRITDEMTASGEAKRIADSVSPVAYVNSETMPSLFCYAVNDPLVQKGNRESMEKVFSESGSEYKYVFFPFSGHGLLLDPWSEIAYYDALYGYCEQYFGY
ncbi:MAG: alpha/beta hydrolase [Clostridia bacterium]|nr:alpha/beta hydrolase [Clostridia bacterium]